MDVTFLWLMVGIKIPVVVLGLIIWRAVRDVPESAEDEGGGGRVRHPRKPLPRPPRRGPHGDPQPAPPRRVRSKNAGMREPHQSA